MSDLTPSQTVGPFFAVLLDFPPPGPTPVQPAAAGARLVTIWGIVRDGAGDPVPDALLEPWHPGLGEVVRAPTDDAGRFEFTAPRPGPTPGPGATTQAPHFALGVLARGLLHRLVTRIYFDGEPRNAADPILALVPESRRGTLVATADGPDRYRFDVVLQGRNETVFLDV